MKENAIGKIIPLQGSIFLLFFTLYVNIIIKS